MAWLNVSFCFLLASLLLPCDLLASTLFDDQEILDIHLRGPLGKVVSDKKERSEYPFELEIDGKTIPVDARIRGNSRVQLCRFPPLRLRFDENAHDTVFSGQDKLKLVTHCRYNSDRSENNVLDEFTAYRIFNLIGPESYRVRLLRVTYDDTNSSSKKIDRAYYGFLIESDDELAERLGGQAEEAKTVSFGQLDAKQIARVFVFQYLIGNTDYSLVRGDGKDHCCHNIDLFERNGSLLAVPFDFDMSGLVDATYAKPSSVYRHKRVTQRRYVGYCKAPIDNVASALADISDRREELLALAESIPSVRDKDRQARVNYLSGFFERTTDQEKLLRNFERHCIGGS